MNKREAWELVRSPELEALMRDPMVDTSKEGFALYHKGEQVWPEKPVPPLRRERTWGLITDPMAPKCG